MPLRAIAEVAWVVCSRPPLPLCRAETELTVLEILETVEQALPSLLETLDGWNTLNIDYHPPHVERVVRHWGDYYINLHRIYPCESSEALFHPHPWPSAIHILSGVYEMAVGYGAGDQPPPFAARMIASGDLKYEMTDRNAWHYVRPINQAAMTIMVTGKRWKRWSPGAHESLRPLDDEVRDEILNFFRDRFPNQH